MFLRETQSRRPSKSAQRTVKPVAHKLNRAAMRALLTILATAAVIALMGCSRSKEECEI
jgi:hypothetical protein